MKEVVIVSAARTAIGNYGESLKDVPAAQLQAITIKGALKKIGLKPNRNPELNEVLPKPFIDVGEIELEKKYNR